MGTIPKVQTYQKKESQCIQWIHKYTKIPIQFLHSQKYGQPKTRNKWAVQEQKYILGIKGVLRTLDFNLAGVGSALIMVWINDPPAPAYTVYKPEPRSKVKGRSLGLNQWRHDLVFLNVTVRTPRHCTHTYPIYKNSGYGTVLAHVRKHFKCNTLNSHFGTI